MKPFRGALVAFEGIDCAGKSSLIRHLPKRLLRCRRKIVVCGEYQSPVKRLISGDSLCALTPFVKTFLFAADRAWTYEKACLPALRSGYLVLWDRYVDSAKAYRWAEIKGERTTLTADFVTHINRPFTAPDLTIFLDITVSGSLARSKREQGVTVYPSSFLRKVQEEYLRLQKPGGYVIIDASRPKAEILEEASRIIMTRLKRLFR